MFEYIIPAKSNGRIKISQIHVPLAPCFDAIPSNATSDEVS